MFVNFLVGLGVLLAGIWSFEDLYVGMGWGFGRSEVGRIVREQAALLRQVRITRLIRDDLPGCQGEPVIITTQDVARALLVSAVKQQQWRGLGLQRDRHPWGVESQECNLYDALRAYAEGKVVKGYGWVRIPIRGVAEPEVGYVTGLKPIWSLPLYYYWIDGQPETVVDDQGRPVRVFYSRQDRERAEEIPVSTISLAEFLRLIQKEPVVIRNPDKPIRFLSPFHPGGI